jgi:hypothetical protein
MTAQEIFHRRFTNVFDIRLLYITDRSQVYMPRWYYSPNTINISLLLLLGGIESNPGPANPSGIRFGSLNICSAVNKGALIDDLVHDNRLNVLAVCESWIRDDAPDVIKNDIAPSDFSILHVHRPRAAGTGRAKMGGGLAFWYNNMSARPIRNNFSPTSFEFQLVGLQVKHILVKVANLYRPPSSSKPKFFDEFADLLTMIGQGGNKQFIICGDFNLLGDEAASIDEWLASLLDIHGYQQHVMEPTRGVNLLDLLITSHLQRCCAQHSPTVRS